MKLKYSIKDFSNIIEAQIVNTTENISIDTIIQSVSYDSRKIIESTNNAFFALMGNRRNGEHFILDAYAKGINVFIVSKNHEISDAIKAVYLIVDNTLISLQKLARYHRKQFNIPIIGITGSVGKTIVKEWLFQLLSTKYNVVKSPKSYNSQLGVALSLLEINETHEIAIIEAGISAPNEMFVLEQMIEPTLGVFTAFGNAHKENFENKEQHLEEKLILFKHTKQNFFSETIDNIPHQNINKIQIVFKNDFENFLQKSSLTDSASRYNLSLAIAVAQNLGVTDLDLYHTIENIGRLALRLETFDGKDGITVINDSYSLDIDALRTSLEYQLSISNGKKRCIIISIDSNYKYSEKEILQVIESFQLDEIHIHKDGEEIPIKKFENSILLIKGNRSKKMENIVNHFRMKVHNTRMEINLSKIKSNLNVFKSYLKKETKLLAMIKASSYGSGADKMSLFLEKNGVDYFGVAYVDEGVELRKNGVKTPILVMNVDADAFETMINYDLEPSIFSFKILDEFISYLINHGKESYPIHLKMDTGMRRLGFEVNEIEQLISILKSQPEVKTKSIFSHLADADGQTDGFTLRQLTIFKEIVNVFENNLSYPFEKHILNTEGIIKYTEHQYSMVRLGIGLYGYCGLEKVKDKLQEVVTWKTKISQLKHLNIGDSVGYNRKFIAKKSTTTATVPVGYADGYRRSLGNGIGTVIINNQECHILGNVCMDMLMIDVTDINVKVGDTVEIISENQPLSKIAAQMNTIVYEVLTGISKRVPRIYIEE